MSDWAAVQELLQKASEDAGKTTYVRVRYENGKGETGLWAFHHHSVA